VKSETLNVKNIDFRIKGKLQYIVGVFLFIVFSIFISNCSVEKYSQSDINKYLTNERAKAKTTPIFLQVPKGWHVVDANNEVFIDLLFVRNDLNVSLSLLPFHSNSSSNNLNKNFETSILMQKAKFKNKLLVNNESPQTIGDKTIFAYSFSVEGKNYRVAVFEHNYNFYELTLFGTTNISIEYFIQELVIFSAK